MFAFVPPPHLTSQMHWFTALVYISVLPLSIWLFQIVITRGFPFLLPRRGQSRRWSYAGLIVCVIILGTGFVTAGKAVRSLLNYTVIDDEGLREVSFRQPTKHQSWKELVGAQMVTRTTTMTTNWLTETPLRTFDGVVLQFKEGGKWDVKITLWSEPFPAADFKAFIAWLKQLGGEQAKRNRPLSIPKDRPPQDRLKPKSDDTLEFDTLEAAPKK